MTSFDSAYKYFRKRYCNQGLKVDMVGIDFLERLTLLSASWYSKFFIEFLLLEQNYEKYSLYKRILTSLQVRLYSLDFHEFFDYFWWMNIRTSLNFEKNAASPFYSRKANFSQNLISQINTCIRGWNIFTRFRKSFSRSRDW